jgi:hypothetical protein
MPARFRTLGFTELTPNQTAYELFQHLRAGDKVAITTRFQSPEVLEYVEALQGRGLIVRVVEGQRDVEDFCFLRKAQRGLAGNVVSTFVKWAAYLGQARHVQLYILEHDVGLREAIRGGTVGDVLIYNWTNPVLKERVHFVRMGSSDTEEKHKEL